MFFVKIIFISIFIVFVAVYPVAALHNQLLAQQTFNGSEIFTFPTQNLVLMTVVLFSNESTFEGFDRAMSFWADYLNTSLDCGQSLEMSLLTVGESDNCWIGDDYNSCLATYSRYNHTMRDKFYKNAIADVSNAHNTLPYIFASLLLQLPQCGLTTGSCAIFKFIGFAITNVCNCREDYWFIDDSVFDEVFIIMISTNESCQCEDHENFKFVNVAVYNELSFEPSELEAVMNGTEPEPEPELEPGLINSELNFNLDLRKNAMNVFVRVNESNFLEAKTILFDYVLSGNDFFVMNSTQTTFIFTEVISENNSRHISIFMMPHYGNKAIVVNEIKTIYGDSFYCPWKYSTYMNDTSSTEVVGYLQYLLNDSNKTQIREQFNIFLSDSFPHFLENNVLSLTSFTRHFDVLLIGNENTTDNLRNQVRQNFQKILVQDAGSSWRLNHIYYVNCDDASTFVQIPIAKALIGTVTFPNLKSQPSYLWIEISGPVCVIIIIVLAIYSYKLLMKYRHEKRVQNVITNRGTLEILPGLGDERVGLFVDEARLHIDFDRVIGKGSSATVYCGSLTGTPPIMSRFPALEARRFIDCRVAVKIGHQVGDDQIEQLLREVDASRTVGFHANICSLLGWTLYRGSPVLIFEPLEGGDLLSWSKKFRESQEQIPEKSVFQLLWQVADALRHVAALNLVHRDVAARNVLLEAGMVAKLADFGLCSNCDESFTYRASLANRLPIRWLPPEALLDRIFSEHSDVWSFGVLIWEVFSFGITPFGGMSSGNELVEFLKDGGRLEKPPSIPPNLWQLTLKCWNMEREKRPRFGEICDHLRSMLEDLTENYGYLPYSVDLKAEKDRLEGSSFEDVKEGVGCREGQEMDVVVDFDEETTVIV